MNIKVGNIVQKGEHHLVTFETGPIKMKIDYCLVRSAEVYTIRINGT